MSPCHIYSTLFTYLLTSTLLPHTIQSTTLNTSLNISSNITFNITFISTYATSDYISTEFMTSYQPANVGISKELLYISGGIFILIILLLLIYCIFRCKQHRKKKQLSKKPVNHLDDIDEDTKKINAFEVTITENKFAMHNTQNAYTVNRLATNSATTNVELNNRNNRINSGGGSVQTVGSLMNSTTTSTMTAMNNQIQFNSTSNLTQKSEAVSVQSMQPVQNSMLPEIKTNAEPDVKSIDFVANTPIDAGDQRNRTGTVCYTHEPDEEKVQAMLEPIDSPFETDEHTRNVTNDTAFSTQTVKYIKTNDNNEEDSDESDVDSSDDGSHSDIMPHPEHIAAVDTLTAMIQQHKNSNVGSIGSVESEYIKHT